MTSRDRLISITAHELKTPLHGIMGLASTLVNNHLPETMAHELKIVGSIKTSALRLLNTINNTLDDASMRETGRLIIKKVPVRAMPLSRLLPAEKLRCVNTAARFTSTASAAHSH